MPKTEHLMREEADMNHDIFVTFVVQPGPPAVELVHADPNPLPARSAQGPQIDLSPGDTVTWHFDPGRKLEVVFLNVAGLSQIGNAGALKLSNPMGPFSSLSVGIGAIVGTIGPGVPQGIPQAQRSFYKLFENGVALPWHNSVQGGNGGGIDNPRTPP
jgi:hypothetical protein